MKSNRRISPRYPFFAATELTAPATGARTETGTTDLCSNGCFLDTPNPLPVGTIIDIQIVYEGQVFKAGGVVAHSHPNIGMGVNFIALESGCADVLESWLHAAALV